MDTSSPSVVVAEIAPLYTKPDGLYVHEIDRHDLPLGFKPTVRHIVVIPPRGISANHKHPRTEAFIALGSDLEMFWQDDTGKIHSRTMNDKGRIHVFVIHAHIPHAIRNNSDTAVALLEYADHPQQDSDITAVHII